MDNQLILDKFVHTNMNSWESNPKTSSTSMICVTSSMRLSTVIVYSFSPKPHLHLNSYIPFKPPRPSLSLEQIVWIKWVGEFSFALKPNSSPFGSQINLVGSCFWVLRTLQYFNLSFGSCAYFKYILSYYSCPRVQIKNFWFSMNIGLERIWFSIDCDILLVT